MSSNTEKEQNLEKNVEFGASQIESKNQPQQDELNLDFSEMEPITPKKNVEPKQGILERFQAWQQARRQKNEKAKPSKEAEPVISAEQVDKNQESTKNAAETTIENVKSVTKPRVKLLSALPLKHQRLALTLLVIVGVLLVFFWLKPKQVPVDNLQEGQIAIQYQPLDQSNTNGTDNGDIPWLNQDDNENATSTSAGNNGDLTQNLPHQGQDVSPQTPALMEQNSDGYTIIRDQDVTSNTIDSHNQQNVQTQNTGTQNSQAQDTEEERVLAILNGKSLPAEKSVPAVTTRPDPVGEDGYKTLVISAGKSLMQVFRDNHLNISDVIAMSNTRGAKVLSNFKPGDKIQVRINGGRVSELRLANGSRFIRNANGSYQYQQ